ncbi:hypothetical protein CERSUDRAFT_135858 [Gelatoporia subvermispora B]|uniref:GST N-terminal domain-containing protein n=1 Tax=Ceriporiopsis subvermispora (strain B) TaxID=914234 RepID=M2QJX1_CERS8|nr:hypothetical protein CERSUDRAFT_135858 [Gelatoporia subvermispora B]
MVQPQITLYATDFSPYSHSVDIALLEAGVNYTRFEVDLQNKPEWFIKQVNPAGQVPALTYGGSDAPPSEPSLDSIKLRESHVLLELVADLFPEARLLPEDPTHRAKVRLFMDVLKTKLLPVWYAHFRGGQPAEPFLVVLEELQAMLPPTGFVAGEWSIADAAIITILVREEVILELEHEVSGWSAGEGKRVLDILHGPRFARLAQYQRELEGRPAFKATFDKAQIADKFASWFNRVVRLRKQQV